MLGDCSLLCSFGTLFPKLSWQWFEAGRTNDVDALWRIHRHIGVGGDQMVVRVAGEDAERRVGDAVRETEGERYAELLGEVRVLPGAREFLADLSRRGVAVVLASSAKQEEVDTYVDMLGAREYAAWTTWSRRRSSGREPGTPS